MPAATDRTPHPIDLHVGRRLRERRIVMGLSQEQLARRLGVTFQQIQKYERGASRIGASRLFRLARILEVPVGWFFEGAEGPDPTAAAAVPGLAEPGAPFTYDAAPPAARPCIALDRREVLELVRHYTRIADPEVRRRLYELTRALAELRYRDGETAGG